MTPVLNLLYSLMAMSVSGMTDMIATEGVSVFTWIPFSLSSVARRHVSLS